MKTQMFNNHHRTMRIIVLVALAVLLALLAPMALPQPAHADPGIIRVQVSGATSGSCGGTWANACGLQYALTTVAASGDELWVASGTYAPTTGTDRAATFQLRNGIALYGGFAGSETARDQRNITANVTTLSGDIGTVGSNTDNSYHVVTGNSTNNTAILDGFTVSGGNANYNDGMTTGAFTGGGMRNISGSPTVQNVIFSNNTAWRGGGMFNYNGSNPILTNVTFRGNSVTGSSPGLGGGMSNWNNSSPTLTNVTFESNSTGFNGGAMHNMNSSPALTNVTFTSNTASNNGGAIYNDGSSSPTLTNVTFSSNTSSASGGGIYNYSGNAGLLNVTFVGNTATIGGGGGMSVFNGSPTLTNVTFSGNSATSSSTTGGGGLNVSGGSATLTNVTFNGNAGRNGGALYCNRPVTVRSTIFWGDSATAVGPEIAKGGSCTLTIGDSVVQGGYTGGTHIITGDPNLGALTGTPAYFPLLAGSSALDQGDLANCPATDERGLARPQGTGCDIGAYELDVTDTTPPDTSITSQPSNPTGSTSVTFAFTGTDNYTPASRLAFECKLDTGAWASCTSPKDYSGLALGSHTFQVRATDVDGNTDSTPASYTWTIQADTTAPAVTIDTISPNPTNDGTTVTWHANEDGTYSVRVGGTDCGSGTQVASGSYTASGTVNTSVAASNLAEGSNTIRVCVTDAASNTGSTTGSVTKDTIAPSSSASSPDYDNGGAISVGWTASDTVSGVASTLLYVRAPGGSWANSGLPAQTGTGGTFSYSPAAGDGRYYFQTASTDNTGNQEAIPSGSTGTGDDSTFYDTAAPATTITSSPANPTTSTSATFNFSGDDGTGSGIAGFKCNLDGVATWSDCNSGTITYNSLSVGSHTFQVYAVDNAGNQDASPASYTWNIAPPDSTPPTINCTVPDQTIWYGANVTVHCTASDSGSGLRDPSDASFDLTTSVSPGTETATAQTNTHQVYDNAGNYATAGPYTFKVDRKAPTVSCGSADVLWHGDDISISCMASDGGSGLVNSGDASFSLSTSVPSGTETSNALTGNHSVCDNAGNCAAAGSISGNKVDKKAPTYSCGAVPSAWSADNVSISCTASDGGSGLATSASFSLSTNVADGTETANASTCTATLTDNVGNSATAGSVGGIKVDKKAPTYSCGAVPDAWSATDVSIACTAGDGGSGLAVAASFSLSTSVANGTETASASTGTATLTDNVGHSITAGPIAGLKVDKKVPQVTSCDAPDGNWHTSDVTLKCHYTDGGSGPGTQDVSLTTNVPVNTETDNAVASAGGAKACDAVGNCAASPADIGGNKVDKKAPTYTCNPAPMGWSGTDISINCAASDGGSGLATSASFSLSTNVANGMETANASTGTATVTDNVGHSVTAGPIAGLKVDKKAPTVAVTGVTEGSVYILGAVPQAACSTTDGGSGVAVNASLNLSGGNAPGVGGFTATCSGARDNAGNAANPVSVHYNVTFRFTGFTSPVDNPPTMNVANAGQAIPLKWRLLDYSGAPVTNLASANVKVTAVGLSCTAGTSTDQIEEYAAGESGLQNLGNGYYQWNWKSPKTYANSCKTFKLDLGEGAGNEHTAMFRFK